MRVQVFWPLDAQFYPGTIAQNGLNGGTSVKVNYDDGDTEVLMLSNEIWREAREKEKLSTLPQAPEVISGARKSMSICVEPAQSASGPRIGSGCLQATATPQPSRASDEEKLIESLAPKAVCTPSMSVELQAKKEAAVEAQVRAVADVKEEISASETPRRRGAVKRASDSPLILHSKTASAMPCVKRRREAKAGDSERTGSVQPGALSSHSPASNAIAVSSARTEFLVQGNIVAKVLDARSLPPRKRFLIRGTSP